MELVSNGSNMRIKPDVRHLTFTVLLIILSGLILTDFNARLSRTISVKEAQAIHSQQKIKAEVKERFQQGVVMLHAKRYDDAVVAFHRVMKLAPKMPEVHVNMGYALLGLKRYSAARDFFESATVLKPDQVNAYYGMAISMESLNDLPGALGAMRTYVHLASADDPYRRKAESAVWEWDEALKLQKQSEASTVKPVDTAGNR